MAGKIFINYRRDDERAVAARIRDRLASVFGNSNVFMDVDNLMAGQRFDKELEKALAETDVFLAVIGPRWMQLLAERQTSGERDYVREEIAGALKRGLTVIPALIEHAPLPRPDALPEDIRELALHQKHTVTHEQFGRDIAGLIEAVKFTRKSSGGASSLSKLRPNSLGWMASGAVGAAAATWAVAYYAGGPVPWPWAPVAISRPGKAEIAVAEKAGVDQAIKRPADLADQLKREKDAWSKAEAEEKRQAELAMHRKRDIEARQRADAEVVARKKGEEDAQLKAAADAEMKREAEEAEKTRLAALIAVEDRKRAEAELARLRGEAEAQRKANDAETKRVAALMDENVSQRATTAAKRNSDEKDQATTAALKFDDPHGLLGRWQCRTTGKQTIGQDEHAFTEIGTLNITKNDGKYYCANSTSAALGKTTSGKSKYWFDAG